MVDIERVVTLDELMDCVPEDLVRDAESRRMEEESATIRGSSMSKEPSKAKRIREYLDKHPGARNKELELVVRSPPWKSQHCIGIGWRWIGFMMM